MISPRNACLLCFPTSSPLHSFFSWEQRIADLSLSGEAVLRFESQTKCPGCLANTGFYLLLYECFLPGNRAVANCLACTCVLGFTVIFKPETHKMMT